MAARNETKMPAGAQPEILLKRLQDLIYDYYALGRFEDARPHILWLMEIAESEVPRLSRRA